MPISGRGICSGSEKDHFDLAGLEIPWP
jgi:hypothetical protein